MRSKATWKDSAKFAHHLWGYVWSGEVSEAHSQICRHRYKVEYLGETLTGGWTVVRVTEQFPQNNSSFIDLLHESLFHLIAHMQVATQVLVDAPVEAWYFDTMTRYHDCRIMPSENNEFVQTIEG